MPILLDWWPVAVMAMDWVAVAMGWRRLEVVAKPAAMLALLVWLRMTGMADEVRLGWFEVGIVCSLAGDVLLLLPEKFFMAGLVAFLLGHVACIVGLNAGGLLLPVEAVLAVPVGLAGGWLARRVGAALKATGREKLRGPVTLYAAVISLMVVSALATLFRPDWPGRAAWLVTIGAVLFFGSDALLAWNRFVAPVRGGRLLVIVAYHLGQMALIAGAAFVVLNPIDRF